MFLRNGIKSEKAYFLSSLTSPSVPCSFVSFFPVFFLFFFFIDGLPNSKTLNSLQCGTAYNWFARLPAYERGNRKAAYGGKYLRRKGREFGPLSAAVLYLLFAWGGAVLFFFR